MRLAYVCADPGIPAFGRKGNSLHVREVITALRRRGIEVVLFAANVDGPRSSELEGLRVIRVPIERAAIPAEREHGLMLANGWVAAALGAEGPFDAVYARHALFSHAPMEFAAAHGIPGLLEVNAPMIQEPSLHRSLVHADAAVRSAARAFDSASTVLTVSEAVAASVRRETSCTAAIVVVPNGVDVARFHGGVVPASVRADTDLVIGFVGSPKPWHGLKSLAAAFETVHKRLPCARLLIVGDGPGRSGLEADLCSRGVEDFATFTGTVEFNRIPSYLAATDIAVAPYPALRELSFSPVELLEYMASGRAIVASRISQIESVIEHGRTGLLVPPGDPSALADSILLLARNATFRHRLGNAARAAAVAEHTWDGVASKILSVICQASTPPVRVPLQASA